MSDHPTFTPRRALLAAGITLLATGLPAQTTAYHDASSSTHQSNFNNLRAQGYRVVNMTVYGTAQDPRYAAVWEQRGGPAVSAFHDATASDYLNFVNQRLPQGFTPIALTATGAGADARFAGFFERTNNPCYIRYDLDSDAFWDEIELARQGGWRINTVDVYGTQNSRRYIVSFEQSDEGQGITTSGSVSQFQDHFDAHTDGWARPEAIAFNDGNRFVSLWTNNRVGGWSAYHDMTSAEYQQKVTQNSQIGRYPISLAASGSGNDVRFAAVFAATHHNRPRTFSATGQAVPALSAFDDWVRNWMETNDARSASLAIARDGRLVYARGYKYAESDYPSAQPTSLYRIASCTKPLTGIAMQQHFDRWPSFYSGRKVDDYFSAPVVLDPRYRDVTLFHLLTHQGGWDRNANDVNPMFMDTTVASALNMQLPVSKVNVRNYMTRFQFMDFAPGTQSQYSNYGFSLLGQVLERFNFNLPYQDILQRDIFTPLGISRIKVRGSELSERLPGEVRYHPRNPYVARSVNDNSRPWVAGQYGGWNQTNMDSHGAHVSTAPDYAKILASFDLGNSNPLMDSIAAQTMWSPAPGYGDVASGWYRRNTVDESGSLQRLMHHGGKLAGTSTMIARRSDRLSFVFFTNADVGMRSGDRGHELSTIANTVTNWPNHDLFQSVGLTPLRTRVPGSFTKVGTGCSGRGIPLEIQGLGTPEVGRSVSVRALNASPQRVAVLMFGPRIRGLDLTGLGAPGCTLLLQSVASLQTLTNSSGIAAIPFPIPADNALFGATFRTQYAVLDPRANSLGIVTSDALDTRLGGWQ